VQSSLISLRKNSLFYSIGKTLLKNILQTLSVVNSPARGIVYKYMKSYPYKQTKKHKNLTIISEFAETKIMGKLHEIQSRRG
jgi:hypothetical protein